MFLPLKVEILQGDACHTGEQDGGQEKNIGKN
jgi:hypothetical protein